MRTEADGIGWEAQPFAGSWADSGGFQEPDQWIDPASQTIPAGFSPFRHHAC
jgi:hypothetical protein